MASSLCITPSLVLCCKSFECFTPKSFVKKKFFSPRSPGIDTYLRFGILLTSEIVRHDSRSSLITIFKVYPFTLPLHLFHRCEGPHIVRKDIHVIMRQRYVTRKPVKFSLLHSFQNGTKYAVFHFSSNRITALHGL